MFEVGTGDKRAISTPRQKAFLIFPQLVLDNEHREGSFKPRTKALRVWKIPTNSDVENQYFVFFLPVCTCVCVYECACTFSSEVQGK